MDGTERTCLEDTHPGSIFQKRHEKESMRAHAHTYAHRIDFALHKGYLLWHVAKFNKHIHTESDCHQSFVQLRDVALQEGSWRER